MNSAPHVAILGAGILGCSLALDLARRGARVVLFDAAPQPFCEASRWNEGKIHLGFLYSADASLRTARHVLPGGLRFRPLVEELIGTSLAPVITQADDVFLCHRRSVVTPEVMGAYYDRVTELVCSHPDARDYLADVSEARSRRLSAGDLAALCGSPDILAGFTVPERSVQTNWVADRFIEAVAAEPGITRLMTTRVRAARPASDSPDGPWRVETSAGAFGPFDHVVNALWQGRMAIDLTAGLTPSGVWSNRYRQSLFLRTREAVDAPCVVVATGPFGDIKNYDGRNFYLSWYPDGLRAESSDIEPPDAATLAMPDPEVLSARVFDHLEDLLPWVRKIRERVERVSVGGGWVFATGQGLLSDPASLLHRRSEYGVARRGRYLSVDTGKYSTAPWTARALADELCPRAERRSRPWASSASGTRTRP